MTYRRWLRENRWVWAAVASLALFVVLALRSERFGADNVAAIAASAAFLGIAAIGQTFAVSTGRGNIDLSVGGCVTVSAFAANAIAEASAGSGLAILAGALLIGVVVGVANGVLVAYLRMPAIIVTLGTGYILATAALLADPFMSTAVDYGSLDLVANGWLGPVPVIVALCIAVAALAGMANRGLTYGRGLNVLGQNDRAAYLAGLDTRATVAGAFAISGALSALTGALLSARLNGAFLDMGTPFLLQSIGAVVIGGTAVMGGSSTYAGSVIGALLLVVMTTTMRVLGVSVGVQEVAMGLIITVLLSASR